MTGLRGNLYAKPPFKDPLFLHLLSAQITLRLTPDPALPCPEDKVNRQFKADRPDQLWVADFSDVPTRIGMVYVAFVIDAFAHKIVGWRVQPSMTTSFVLDALNQAICQRRPGKGLIRHSDRGSQYLSIKYSQRLAGMGIERSVGSVGDAYDNAMAESTIGLFKTEVINFVVPWKSLGQVEWETLKWVSWYNRERLHSAISYKSPDKMEKIFYENRTIPLKKKPYEILTNQSPVNPGRFINRA